MAVIDSQLKIVNKESTGCKKRSEDSEQLSIEYPEMYGIQLILPAHFRSSELPVNKLKKAISV